MLGRQPTLATTSVRKWQRKAWHPSTLDLEFPAREIHALQSKGQNHRSEKGHD